MNAEDVARGLDDFERDYLLSFAGAREPKPWGAAMSCALEALADKELIAGECDASLTPLGLRVAALLKEE